MAEEAEKPQIVEEEKPDEEPPQAAADMDLEAATAAENGGGKRVKRDEENEEAKEENGGGGGAAAAKKQKVEKSVEEERLEKKMMGGDEGEGEAKEVEGEGEEEESGEGEKEKKDAEPVKLGPKQFFSSVEMFDYFVKLLHSWAPNLDVNKYEYLVLQDLLQKGHPEHSKKIGAGVRGFQVRHHPLWKSCCFFIARVDGSFEDFSFRKCVDHILPLPDDMKASDKCSGRSGRNSGRQQKGGGRGGRGGRGKKGRF